jgi:hypothetical protein
VSLLFVFFFLYADLNNTSSSFVEFHNAANEKDDEHSDDFNDGDIDVSGPVVLAVFALLIKFAEISSF